MPQRVIHAWMIVVGIVGLVLVAALVLFGADLRRASRTGPRWKRRLVTAALALLSGLSAGLAGRHVAQTARAAPPSTPAEAKADPVRVSLAGRPQWKRLTATWKEADDVASGRKGRYPFNAEGRKALLAALSERVKDVDALAAGGLLTAPEAALLKKGLNDLTQGVQRMRPVEMRMATCYKPMAPITWPCYSLGRLKDRLALLARLAEAKTINPLAVRTALAAIEVDIQNLERPGSRTWMLDAKKAQEVLREAKPLVVKIRARVGGSPGAAGGGLVTTAQWKAVLDAWKFTKPLAETHKSTMAQRKEADQKLAAAKQAIVKLANDGVIAPAEGGLLAAEADTIRKEIFSNPPIDSRVKCYEMMYIPPARASFTRLQKRLPLLQKLAERGKVTAAVIARVLPTVKADLATLADPKQAQKLRPTQRADAERTATAAKAAVAKIERLLPSAGAKGT